MSAGELIEKSNINEEKYLDLTMKVWEKTLASQIIPMEDVPKTIEKILTNYCNYCKQNYCKRNVKVKGDGLTENMEVRL